MIVFHGPYKDDDELISAALSSFFDMTLIAQVEELRAAISTGLKVRKMKLRQPLARATVITKNPYLFTRWSDTVLVEWNVKLLHLIDIRCLSKQPNPPDHIEFDLNLTDELKGEGWVAEFKRAFQNQRKVLKLNQTDTPRASFSAHTLIHKYRDSICDDVNVVYDQDVPFQHELVVEGQRVQFGLKLD